MNALRPEAPEDFESAPTGPAKTLQVVPGEGDSSLAKGGLKIPSMLGNFQCDAGLRSYF